MHYSIQYKDLCINYFSVSTRCWSAPLNFISKHNKQHQPQNKKEIDSINITSKNNVTRNTGWSEMC